MEHKQILWMGVGVAACVALTGVVAAATGMTGLGGGDAKRLSLDLLAGGSYALRSTSEQAVLRVEAGYEITNRGSEVASVTLTLTGPDGVVGSRSLLIEPGRHRELEVEHAFAGASGPAGLYVATIEVGSGAVHLTEGEVEFGEDDRDGDEGPGGEEDEPMDA